MTGASDGDPTGDIAALREEYARGGLEESMLAADPLTMFRRWFAEAREAGLYEPNAMVVATVSPEGQPSSRFVLLKVVDERGFGFFTNTGSAKGRDLAANAACSLLFPWHPLERQVRIEGSATPLPRTEVEAYFASRPRRSRLGAWASPQSEVIADRAALDAAYRDLEERFGEEVPVPDQWGGYLVAPRSVEFWQGRPGRMHDRLRYRRASSDAGPADLAATTWIVERLAP